MEHFSELLVNSYNTKHCGRNSDDAQEGHPTVHGVMKEIDHVINSFKDAVYYDKNGNEVWLMVSWWSSYQRLPISMLLG